MGSEMCIRDSNYFIKDTDNQDCQEHNNQSLGGGVWSLVRIQSPRLVKSIDNRKIVDAFFHTVHYRPFVTYNGEQWKFSVSLTL